MKKTYVVKGVLHEKNICCVCSLELDRLGDSNEEQQHMIE